MIYRKCIIVECRNDQGLAKRIRNLLNIKFKILHLGNKSEILDSYVNNKVVECIIFLDLDNPNEWLNRWRKVLDNKNNISILKSTYIYIDFEKKVIIILFEKNLEDWLIRNCNLNVSWSTYIEKLKLFVDMLIRIVFRLFNV